MSELVFSDIAISFIMVLAAVAVFKVFTARQKANAFYQDHVVAYKVGLIRKRAEENGIELIYPPGYDEVISEIEEEVTEDLS